MPSTAFVILTGFLGSGKTTLLNRLLRRPDMADTAVLVNELGEVGIDQWLIEPLTDGVVLLESGCVCCSVRDDLTAALASLLAKRRAGVVPPFRRIILETTGIAVPGPIAQLVLADEELARNVHLAGILTVVDGELGALSLERHIECIEQVATADQLVVTKLDIASPAVLETLRARLRTVNPLAPIIDAEEETSLAHDLLTVDLVRLPRPHESNGAAYERQHVGHAARFSTFALSWEQPVEWCDLEAWLDNLLIARGDDILRIKGLVNVAGSDQPIVLQGVQHTLYPPTRLPSWPHGLPRTELVFITRDFSRAAAMRSIGPFTNIGAGVSS